ncbi:TPA: hypothetical protein ACQWGN_002253, partial [Neisseria subflava]
HEGSLKERNDGSYEHYLSLSDAQRQQEMLAHSPAYAQAYQEARSWGVGGSKSRALSAAETLITGALGGQGDLQLAANTLAPYAAAAIGKRFGHGEHKNEAAQAIGHFMLGAALAYANGADPLAGGSAAVAAERAAEYLAKQYDDGKTAIDPTTGKFNPNLLPEPIKEEIKAQTGVIASVVGAAGGSLKGGSKSSTNGTNINALFNAQVGGVLGQNAVGNNYLSPGLTIPFVDKEISPDQIKKFGQELGENCGKTGNKASCAATYDKWKNLSYKQGGLDPNDTSWENFVALMYQQEVLPLCKGNKSCEAHVVTSMQLNVVLNAGDAAGLRDSIEVDRRAVNIANGNWVRAGLDTLGDVSTILGMRAMVNPNSAYSKLMNSVFATPSKTGMPRSTTQLGIVGNWEQKALPKPSLSSLANLTSKEQKLIRYLARDNGKIIINGKQIPVDRLPQDINVKPTPPSPLNGSGRTIGKSKSQNQIMQDDVAYLRSMGAEDIRINQQQVNNQMCRVGICRPDVQATLPNSNKRIYIEYDRTSSNRGAGHASRALSNDPDAIVILRTVD